MNASKPDPARAARLLLRASRVGTLATSDAGQPFASLITPATAPDGSVLMLLSGLSPHTRHLRAEPRCSVLVTGAATGPNPQTAPRLTAVGTARPEPDSDLKARWVTLHPYAAFYANLGDFQLWRFRPSSGQFVGGFASAHRLSAPALGPDPVVSAAWTAGESAALAQCNAQCAPEMDELAAAGGLDGRGWRMVACDPDGFDLGLADVVLRVPWDVDIGGPDSAPAAVRALADAARNPVASGPRPGV